MLILHIATVTRNELIDAMINYGSVEQCFGINNASVEECDKAMTCNWAVCNSLNNTFCNAQNCTDPNLPEYFCGACQSGFCAEVRVTRSIDTVLELHLWWQVSSFGHCEYNATSSDECTAAGGSYNGLAFAIVATKCFVPNVVDRPSCYPPQFCSSVSDLMMTSFALSFNRCTRTCLVVPNVTRLPLALIIVR